MVTLAEMLLNKRRLIFLHGMESGLSVTSKKSRNVSKSCPKMISLEKSKMLTPFQKLPKNVGDLGKIIVARGFKKLPKVQKIAQSGHTERGWLTSVNIIELFNTVNV